MMSESPRRAVWTLGASAAIVFLTACASSPQTPQVPMMSMPKRYGSTEAIDPPQVSAQVRSVWGCLSDPVVNWAVQRGLTSNDDIEVAAARVDQAAALVRQRQAERLPSVGASTSVTRQRVPVNEQLATGAVSGTSYRAESTGRWDLDISGRLAVGLSAEAARLALAQAQAEDTRRRVAAEVAVRVMQLRSLEARLRARDDALAALRGQVDVAERRRAAGVAPATDGARLLYSAAQAEAVLAGLRREHREALQATAFELAVSASTLEGWLQTPTETQSSSCVIEAGAPGELLARRADLLAAYQAVAAAIADRQAVELGKRPNLVLDTSLGWSALSLSKLFNSGALIYSAAATLDLKLFDFGRIDAQIDGARAAERESWLRYRGAARQAVTDVESALTTLSTSREAVASLEVAHRQQTLLVESGRQRRSAGLADASGLLEAMQAEALLREQMADAHFQEMRAAALLIRALGAPS